MSDLDWREEDAGTRLGNRLLFKQIIEIDGVGRGWITRNGEWYPVGFGAHEAFAWLFWKLSEYETEQVSIKVCDYNWDGGPDRPTRFQRRTLEALGFLNGTGEPRYREGKAEDVPMARDLRAALDEWKEKQDAERD